MIKENNKTRLFIVLGILIIFFLFFAIEIINPYNFLNDDNAVQFLPNILEGMEQLFHGNLPSINLHQLMGTKILETGIYSVLYPLMILSYFFSHYIFANDFLTMELFVLFHLILGFVFSFLFLKQHTKKLLASFLGSFFFVFSGYVISLSIAWYYVVSVVLFLPLIFYLNDKLSNKNKKIPLILGILRGIYFYAGNVQYFVFTLFFEFVYFIIKEYQLKWEDFSFKFKNYLFSLLLTFIIIFPLLFSQINVSSNSLRGDIPVLKYLLSKGALPLDIIIGSIISPDLLDNFSIFFRYPLAQYSGTLFSLLFFLGGIFLLIKYKKNSFKKISPIFWCGVFSIILSLGIFGFLYSIGSLIPFIKNFEGPFKFIMFTNFFMICFGAIIFSKIIEKKYLSRSLIFSWILISIILLTNTVLFFSSKLESNYFEKLPPNEDYFKEIYPFQDYRFISVATGSEFSPKISSSSMKSSNFPESYFLSKNFATYFDIDHISGYEHFVDRLTSEKIPIFREGISNKYLNLTTLQEYGVKYIIIFKEGLNFHSELRNLNSLYEKDNFLILEIPHVKGYVFYEGGNLNYTRLYNGFSFDTSFNKQQIVTINLLYKKGYVCKINNKKVNCIQDPLGRIIIDVPKANNTVEIYYLPKDFIMGVLISAIIFVVLILILLKINKSNIILPKIDFNRFIMFISKNKWKILLFIVIFLVLLIFISLLSKSNIENSIENKFGIDIDIGDIKFGLRKISFQEVYILNNKEITFYSSEILLKPDYKKSFNNFLSSKKPALLFKEISLHNSSLFFSFNNISDNSCESILNISYPILFDTLKSFVLSKDILYLNDSYISLPNKFYFSLDKESFTFSSEKSDNLIYISANLTLGRYIFGEINASYISGIQNNKQDCFILPIEKKNNVFY